MTLEIKIYGKESCNLCKVTKDKIRHFLKTEKLEQEVNYSFVDMSTVDGLTESAMLNVSDIPTTVINYKDEEVYRMSKQVPSTNTIKEELDKYLLRT